MSRQDRWRIVCGTTTATVRAPTHADAIERFLSWSPARKREAMREKIESVVLVEDQIEDDALLDALFGPNDGLPALEGAR